ncbi:MAG: MotA/TolQ/ExbB proton channel family protein, partial [Pedobacter sp.]|nr:MotA/TolQ/ExbB proton channel family protein [Pedobacter sp.]
TTVANAGVEVPTATAPSISLLELLFKGGWVMAPILFLSLVAIYVVIERILVLNRASSTPKDLVDSLKAHILRADLNTAETMVSKHHTPVGEMLLKGIKRIGRPVKEIESAMENTGRIEIMKLEKNLNLLGIIAAVSPMLGFVGTISGVIKIFYNISLADNISIGLIAGGLYEKMITSAAGLIVGIIAHTSYQLLNMKIDSISLEMEKSGVEFVDVITEHK